MLIDERARKIVAYLIEEDFPEGESRKLRTGTCFFVGMEVVHEIAGAPVANVDPCPVRYAVTARHVITSFSPGNNFYIRLNLKAGGYRDVPTDPGDWFCNPASDVAIYRMREWPDDIETRSTAIALFWAGPGGGGPEHDELMVGDEVATIGLFAEYPGTTKNQPVVRFGRVALPHEQMVLQVADDAPTVSVDVFVIEATSWSGQSGSPVLLYWPHFREWQKPDQGDRGPWLLGLIHGSFNVDQKVRNDLRGEWRTQANAGLSVVIPACDILATINLPDVQEDRSEVVAAHLLTTRA